MIIATVLAVAVALKANWRRSRFPLGHCDTGTIVGIDVDTRDDLGTDATDTRRSVTHIAVVPVR